MDLRLACSPPETDILKVMGEEIPTCPRSSCYPTDRHSDLNAVKGKIPSDVDINKKPA
jgi:hypothetical protein